MKIGQTLWPLELFTRFFYDLKTRSVGQIIENLVNTLEATVIVHSSSNLLRMII